VSKVSRRKTSGLGALGALFSTPVLLVGGGALLLAMSRKKKDEEKPDPCARSYTPDIVPGSCKQDEQTGECVCTLTDAAQGRHDAQSVFFYDSAGTVAWTRSALTAYSEGVCAKSADSAACVYSKSALTLAKDDGAVGAPLAPLPALGPLIRERYKFDFARLRSIMDNAAKMPPAYQAAYQTTFLSLVDGIGTAAHAVPLLDRVCGINSASFECATVTARWNSLK
jgi:hypothetical protein